MINKVLRQIKNKTLISCFLILGYSIAILVLSLGISRINEDKKVMEESKGTIYKQVVNMCLQKNIDFNKLNEILKPIGKNCSVEITNLGLGLTKYHTHVIANAVIFPPSTKEKPPFLEGKNLSSKETLSSNKKVVIGKLFSSSTFKENNKKFIKIDNEKYEVIGIMGTKNRHTAYDATIYISINAIPSKLKDVISTSTSFNLIISNNTHLPQTEIKLLETYLNKLDKNSKVIKVTDKKESISKLNYKQSFSMVIKEVLLVFLIALINLINSSIYWIHERKKEIIIKKTVGATNLDIFKELFLEFTGFALIGTCIGLLTQKILVEFFSLSLTYRNISVYITWVNFTVAIFVTFLSGLITTTISINSILKIKLSEGIKS